MTSDRATCQDGAPRRLAPWALALATASGALAWLASGQAATPLPADVEAAQSTITTQDLRASVTWLASDALSGRGVGHAGNDMAAHYLAAMLEAADIAPLDDQGFLRPLDVVTPSLGPDTRLTHGGRASSGSTPPRYAAGDHFQPLPSSPSGQASGELAFAGFGISAPSRGYDDYAGLDVTGRIVVAFERTPTDGQGLDPLGDEPGEFGSARSKALAAKARGAVALLLVPPVGDRRLPALDKAWPAAPSVRQRRVHLAGQELPLPVARVSGTLASALIAGTDGQPPSLDALQAALVARARGEAAGRLATSFPVDGGRADVVLDLGRTPLPAVNVMGQLEGADPAVRDAFVLVGAHFDHDGLDDRQRIFNGADDNASGVAGVLEIAEAFARLAEAGRRPRRTVVFALWNGEEHGLLGSQHFADHLAADGRRAAAVLNLDMIGRDEHVPPGDRRFHGLDPTPASRNRNTLHVLGYSYSPQLLAVAREENAATRLTLRTTLDEGAHRLVRRSDHWPFLQARVPALFFFTGLHPDYHTPDDDVGRLNFEKMARIVQLAFRVAWRVADAPEPPAFVDPPSPE